jgi:hypothetical protein
MELNWALVSFSPTASNVPDNERMSYSAGRFISGFAPPTGMLSARGSPSRWVREWPKQRPILGTLLIDEGHRWGGRPRPHHGQASFRRAQPPNSVPKMTEGMKVRRVRDLEWDQDGHELSHDAALPPVGAGQRPAPRIATAVQSAPRIRRPSKRVRGSSRRTPLERWALWYVPLSYQEVSTLAASLIPN